MRNIITTFFCIWLLSTNINGQTLVDVAENTLKISGFGEEIFYYGFAEGDQLIFNLSEVNGKELKEVEITELPSSSKFMDYKTKKIENKTINIARTGIYSFRLSNSAMAGRVCKIKIQRIPATEETIKFNSSVYFKSVYDTSYSIVQEKYLISSDTSVVNLTDQVAKVHSQTNLNGSKTTLNFTLPPNTFAWSYYIGVDQAGKKAYDEATTELTSKASPLLSSMPGFGPLALIALGGTSYISTLQQGEDIDYYLVPSNNVNLFTAGLPFTYLKKGKVINDFARMVTPLKGDYHVCLSNDNAVTGVTVSVKITAIVVKEQWASRPVEKMDVSTRQVAYLKD